MTKVAFFFTDMLEEHGKAVLDTFKTVLIPKYNLQDKNL